MTGAILHQNFGTSLSPPRLDASVLFACVLTIRALLVGVHIEAPNLWNLPYTMYYIPYTMYSISYSVYQITVWPLIVGTPILGIRNRALAESQSHVDERQVLWQQSQQQPPSSVLQCISGPRPDDKNMALGSWGKIFIKDLIILINGWMDGCMDGPDA